ncbi:MAG: type IV pilus assembly protein PilN [Flavobacteriales bacterium]|jgi:type IV pilus assembly protein PilN
MAQINLLPWREEVRQEKKKEFLIQLVGVAIVSGLLCFAWIKSVDASISSQRERNQMLTSKIGLLKKEVNEIQTLKKKKKELEQRIRVIQDLEGKRSTIVHYFDELVRIMPEGVYFTSLSRKGGGFSVKGISESNQKISELMRRIDENTWFVGAKLKTVVASPGYGPQSARFDLTFKATLPPSKVEAK